MQSRPNCQPSALEDLQFLDIRELKRYGFLVASSRATVTWKFDGQDNGHTDIECANGALRIHHRHRSYDGTWKTARQCVAIDYTYPPLGGSRPWFVCPDCGGRCAKLYFDQRFKCRGCTGLMYYSQRVDERHRLLARMIGIRQQLDGLTVVGEFIPQRPKGMHRLRYNRLVQRYRQLELKLDQAERRYCRSSRA